MNQSAVPQSDLHILYGMVPWWAKGRGFIRGKFYFFISFPPGFCIFHHWFLSPVIIALTSGIGEAQQKTSLLVQNRKVTAHTRSCVCSSVFL